MDVTSLFTIDLMWALARWPCAELKLGRLELLEQGNACGLATRTYHFNVHASALDQLV
jgi:hypothetical protein